MKRVWGHAVAVTAALGMGSIAVPACVHDNSTMFIRNALAPQLVSNGQECIFTSDPTQTFIPGGVLDIEFLDSYTAEFLVGNQTVPRGDPTAPKAETSRITIEGGIVRITDLGNKQLTSFTVNTSATIDPQQGTTPSYAPVGLTILDQRTVESFRGAVSSGTIVSLVTYTRIFGHTLGGQYVETGEFQFPVDLCSGCLIRFAPQDIDPNYPVQPNCQAAKTGAASTLPVPCFRGQDIAVDCSQCQDIPACSPGGSTVVITPDAGAG